MCSPSLMKETGPEWSTEHPELPHAERPVIPDGILARPVPEVGPCSPAAILSGSLGGRVKRRQAARHTEGLAKCARDTYNAPPTPVPSQCGITCSFLLEQGRGFAGPVSDRSRAGWNQRKWVGQLVGSVSCLPRCRRLNVSALPKFKC